MGGSQCLQSSLHTVQLDTRSRRYIPDEDCPYTGFIMYGDLLRLQPAKRPVARIFVAAVNDAVV
jgi:hypothetical protein